MLDEVFDSPYLPAEIKTVFGRLQIPILKAALADQDVFTDPRHRVRHFFDTLAAAAVGLRPDDSRDALFIALADHLAGVVRDDFADDLGVFATVHDALEAFLDTERAAFNQKLAQAVPALVALDEHAAARTRVRAVLAMRLAGKPMPASDPHLSRSRRTRPPHGRVPAGRPRRRRMVRSANARRRSRLEHRTRAGGRRTPAAGAARPQLVRTVGEGWPGDDEARARRAAFLAALYDLHLQAMNAPQDAPPAIAEPAAASPPASNPPAGEGMDADSLMRGDWCVFEEPDAPPLLAKFAWRAPHGTQLLFTHRDGTIAVIHTPATLARRWRAAAHGWPWKPRRCSSARWSGCSSSAGRRLRAQHHVERCGTSAGPAIAVQRDRDGACDERPTVGQPHEHFAVVAPAGTTMLAGVATRAGCELASVTATPPAGAAADNVTRTNSETPPITRFGSSVSDATVALGGGGT